MTLSILIPHYNHGKYLLEMLDQIRKQTLQPDEVVVIDDASTDQSVQLIKEYDPTLTLIENKKNLGVVGTLRKGARLLTGKYVIYLSADDWIFPSFFEACVEALESHPTAGLATGRMAFFRNQKPYEFSYSKAPQLREGFYSPREVENLYRRTSLFIYTTSTCYRREIVPEQEEAFGFAADWAMNQFIGTTYGIVFLSKVFGACRVVESSYAASSKMNPTLRGSIFEALIQEFKRRGKRGKRAMVFGGILSQLGIQMIKFLLKRPRYWYLLPMTMIKKVQFYLATRLSKCSFSADSK